MSAPRVNTTDPPPVRQNSGTRPTDPPRPARLRAVNRLLLGSPVTRPVYLALWVPNGLVVGCEALFVPYGHGSVAGYLFAAGASGMILGDLVVGRFVGRFVPDDRRDGLINALRLLLAAPYVVFLVAPPAALAVVLVFVASVGYAASLPLQERLIWHTDPAIQGQTMGLFSQGMMVWQALGALIGGSVASYLRPDHAIGVMAVASQLVSALLTVGLRRSAPAVVSACASPSS